MEIKLETLAWHAKHLKKSSPGPDGWARHELALLPKQAWKELLDLLPTLPQALERTFLDTYRRVPMDKEKHPIPLAQDFRPIDVYSMLIRLLAATRIAALRWWINQVRHPSQYATQGGIIKAASKLGALTEAA